MESSEEFHIGWIGLDSVGYTMSSRLARKGHRLVVRDDDSERGILFETHYPKCRVATSDPGSFEACDLLILCLPASSIVRGVLLGEKGIASALRAGSTVLNLTPSSPLESRALGEELTESSIDLLDVSIMREREHALEAGDDTLMVGYDSPTALKKAMPVLEDMSPHVFPVGKVGAGNAMQALTGYVSATSLVTVCDALKAGQNIGLDP